MEWPSLQPRRRRRRRPMVSRTGTTSWSSCDKERMPGIAERSPSPRNCDSRSICAEAGAKSSRAQAARRDAELTHVLVVHIVLRPLRPLRHLLQLLLCVCSCLRLLLLRATGHKFARHEALLAAYCVPVAGREATGERAVEAHRAPAFVEYSVDLVARCGCLETLFAMTKSQLPSNRLTRFI